MQGSVRSSKDYYFHPGKVFFKSSFEYKCTFFQRTCSPNSHSFHFWASPPFDHPDVIISRFISIPACRMLRQYILKLLIGNIQQSPKMQILWPYLRHNKPESLKVRAWNVYLNTYKKICGIQKLESMFTCITLRDLFLVERSISKFQKAQVNFAREIIWD